MSTTEPRHASSGGADTGSDGQQPGTLKRKIGTASVVWIVLAYLAPLGGVAGYVPLAIGYGNGAGAPMTYALVGLGMLVVAVGFVALTRHVPNPGAFYAYITAGLGRRVGLGASMLSVFLYLVAGLGFFVFGGIVTADVVHVQFGGPEVPWWVCSLILIAITTALSYRGVEFNARVMTVLLIVEASVVIVFNVVASIRDASAADVAAVVNPASLFEGDLGTAILFSAILFVGFETCAIYSEEMRDPKRSVGRATYITVTTIAVFYAFAGWGYIAFYGADEAASVAAADPAGSWQAAVSVVLGNTIGDIVSVLVITSVLASSLAVVNLIGRYLYSLSVDRMLPSALTKVHPRFGSPSRSVLTANGIFAALVLVIVVSTLDPVVVYSGAGGAGALFFLTLLALVSTAVIVYFRRNRDRGESVLKTLVAPIIALALIVPMGVYVVGHLELITGTDYVWFAVVLTSVGFALLLAGIIIATWLARARPESFARIGRNVN